MFKKTKHAFLFLQTLIQKSLLNLQLNYKCGWELMFQEGIIPY